MAANVFGTIITNATLEGMPEYAGRPITRRDRARVALDMRQSGGRDQAARNYCELLKAQWGNGVSTKCVIYNATGDTVSLEGTHDWYGHIGPSPYPLTIGNGQWGAFLHVKRRAGATGSSAAVVYGGRNNDDDRYDWMLSWSNPWNRASWDNTVYTEIRQAGYFSTDRWRSISTLLYASSKLDRDIRNGCYSSVTTGTGTTVFFEGIMTLDGLLRLEEKLHIEATSSIATS